MSAIFFSRTIGPVPVSVFLREGHSSTLGITENPIETGAKITDHAYVEPKRVEIEFADENATATWNTLVRFQESRQPFVLVSGLFVYDNMLIKELNADRDPLHSRILRGRALLQEIIIVSTAYVDANGDGAGQGGTGKQGQPGGKKSTTAASPSRERAGDAVTRDRASGTVVRGDAPEKTVPLNQNQSILSRMLQ